MLRIGLIGCGGIGSMHVDEIRQIDNVKIVAAVDIIPERAAKIAEQEGCPAFTDFREALDLVDAVWVCTPPDSHRDITIACLEAGKDVLCEKPMALTLTDADDMIAAAKRTGKTLAIGYCLRFSPSVRLCKEIVESGEIGEVSMAWIARMSDIPGTDWLKEQSRSGGMLTEQTTHNLDWLRFVVGDVVKVSGMAKTVRPDVTIKDNVVGLIEFENGAIGQLMASWTSAASWIDSGIVGTKGLIKTGQGGPITIHKWGAEPEVREAEKLDFYLEEDRVFVDCVMNNKPYPVDPIEAKKSLALSLAVLKAAETGESVTI